MSDGEYPTDTSHLVASTHESRLLDELVEMAPAPMSRKIVQEKVKDFVDTLLGMQKGLQGAAGQASTAVETSGSAGVDDTDMVDAEVQRLRDSGAQTDPPGRIR